MWPFSKRRKLVPRLKEDDYPVDSEGRPDLARFVDTPEYYFEMHQAYIASLQGPRIPDEEARLAYRKRVHATWGLIAQGRDAIPYALRLLDSKVPEAREDGATVLGEVGRDEEVVQFLTETLGREQTLEGKDSIILALGALKNEKAIPALAVLIRDENTDSDTQWTAIESLGKIVRKRFLKREVPLEAAREWLDGHGF